MSELKKYEKILRNSRNEWHWKVACLITKIPKGYLVSYGDLANYANKKYSLNLRALNIGWLRRYLYKILTHNTTVPLHRIATKGDVDSGKDSRKTRALNNKLRAREGIFTKLKWWKP